MSKVVFANRFEIIHTPEGPLLRFFYAGPAYDELILTENETTQEPVINKKRADIKLAYQPQATILLSDKAYVDLRDVLNQLIPQQSADGGK